MELFLITTTLIFITCLSKSSPGLFGLVNWEKKALGTRLLVHDNLLHGLLQIATNCDRYYWNCDELTRGNCDRGCKLGQHLKSYCHSFVVIPDSSPRNKVSCCSFISFFHYSTLLITVFKYSSNKFFKNIVNSFFLFEPPHFEQNLSWLWNCWSNSAD